MTINATENPVPLYLDTDGSPLDNGSIYFGIANLNPETNPLTVYWDDAATQPAAQPIKTINGQTARSGTPAQVYVGSDYSQTVRNNRGALVSNVRKVSKIMSASMVTYTQGAAWAVATTVQDKLRETISVLDGMTAAQRSDVLTRAGTLDMSAVVQSALDYAASTGKRLYFPAGLYLFNGARAATNHNILTLSSNTTIFGDGLGTEFKIADNYTNGGEYAFMSGIDASSVNNIDISKVYFNGNAANNLVGATFTATVNGGDNTKIDVTGVSGIIRVGDVARGTGIAGGSTIVSQSSGTTGGAGTYKLSAINTTSAAVCACSNTRSARSVWIRAGDNISIHDCYVKNHPGRNVFNIGQITGDPVCTNVRIKDNVIWDVGGAIVGNEAQNDHSAIYVIANRYEVSGNFLGNTVQPSASAPVAKGVTAIEVHGWNGDTHDNHIHNFTNVANIVASITDNFNCKFHHNTCTGITSNHIVLWNAGTYSLRKCLIAGNTFECDNTQWVSGASFAGGTPIFQSASTGVTDTQMDGITIVNNSFVGKKRTLHGGVYFGTPINNTWHGIQLTAVRNAIIKDNYFEYMQGAGVNIAENAALLDIDNVLIEGNTFKDCGIHMPQSELWAVKIANASTVMMMSNIRVRGNKIIRTPLPVGVDPYGATGDVPPGTKVGAYKSRGIAVIGAGLFSNVVLENNTFQNIGRALRYTFTSIVDANSCTVIPPVVMRTKANALTSGNWQNLYDRVGYIDVTAGASYGQVVSTDGSAVGATWAATTAYKKGAWVKTSTNLVLQCLVAGTSDVIANEPAGLAAAPTWYELGAAFVDGTVTWIYRDNVIAVFTDM